MIQLYKKNGAVFIPAGITVEEVEKLKSIRYVWNVVKDWEE